MITVPAKRPPIVCANRDHARYFCNRRNGHTGRHAFIWYGLSGRVRDVWGGKP